MENITCEGKTYKNAKEMWKVIRTMITELNIEQQKQKFLPYDMELKVGYKMDDINFNHTVVIENGSIKADEGIKECVDVIISVSSQTFHDMNVGKLNPMKALTSSLLEFEKGDINQILLAGNMPTMLYYRKACEVHGIA
ncbi:SCP2 sterol-binding domain-containing protein [Maledivibacter halophilus]|uniref:Putative sterol carrier protein n=1 Tax=Maledivibacter halophilus TaxID=36842 RepID=A0A1T5LLI3_9FIRM|nr:SCP2 sterol-binding domain-containing protein [Maledivibacter halophilus]SKC76398.1 Putative sterol carrier protein [Maledivibacter halophilus]